MNKQKEQEKMKRFFAVVLALTLTVASLFCVSAKADMG